MLGGIGIFNLGGGGCPWEVSVEEEREDSNVDKKRQNPEEKSICFYKNTALRNEDGKITVEAQLKHQTRSEYETEPTASGGRKRPHLRKHTHG